MSNWATIKSKAEQDHDMKLKLNKWPRVHYLKLVAVTDRAVLVDFGLLHDVWIPKKVMYELNEEEQTFQVSRSLLKTKVDDIKSLEDCSPKELKIKKDALLFAEWRTRDAEEPEQ